MSNFVVSARKYRPIRFEDVVGQEHVTQTLKNALKNDHLAHAFLFCGPRGVGKTTCARILAKVLNCQNLGSDYEPCGKCSSCLAFNENASFNIMELDAASNNSVEHIRALIEQVRFQPQQGKYKVFIIDEVHMLSQQAFNAFLKTLEEPPSYAIFILATTEKHKIIPTILSRCQIFDFKRIQVPRMVSHLKSISEQESINADEDALHIIAQKADGALRDALSIYDRVVSFSGDQISYQDVITNLNVLDYDYYFKIVDAFLMENISQVLLGFDDILKKGFDPDIFMNGLAEHFRNLLVAQDPATQKLLELSETLQKKYLQQAQLTSPSFLLSALNIANECDIHYKMARNKRLHVEMSLIKMNYINRAVKATSGGGLALPEKKNIEPKLVVSTPQVEQQKQPDATANTLISSKDVIENVPEEPIVEPQLKSNKLKVKKLDLNALMAEVKEDKVTQEKSRKEVTMEELQSTWKKYVNENVQDSLKPYLLKTELAFENDTITATVGSGIAESSLRQETGLMEFLRNHFMQPKLALNVVLDRSKLPETKPRKKPLTSKEKLKKLNEINPNVRELWKRFDLRLDDD
ncbi:MAG: DNA polymerase III subunit gamma/tau [Bacteroidota bacterium]